MSEKKEGLVLEPITQPQKVKRTIKSDSAPQSLYVIGGMSILFWPIAAAILAYFSLKTLKSKISKYVIPASILYSVIVITIILLIPEEHSKNFWYFVKALSFGLITAFYYPEIMKWEKENPEVKYRNKIFIDLLWSILGLIVMLILTIIVWIILALFWAI